MKYIIICLIISIVACSADESIDPSTRISKIPNFISGSSDKPYAEVILKEVEISSDGYIEKETFRTNCDENGYFSFDNFENGNYVVIGKSDDRIAYRPNITVQDESLDIGKLEFQEYCSITGSINGDNLINSFILGLTSSEIVDGNYTLDSVPKGFVELAFTNGEIVNVVPVKTNGIKDEYTVSTVAFQEETNEQSTEYYDNENIFYVNSFTDSIGTVITYFPDEESGELVQVNKPEVIATLVDGFEDGDKFNNVNTSTGPLGYWTNFATTNTISTTLFSDISSILIDDEENGKVVNYVAEFGDNGEARPLAGLNCRLDDGYDLSNLYSISFKAKGNLPLEVRISGNYEKDGEMISSNTTFTLQVELTDEWQEFDIPIVEFFSSANEYSTYEEGLWDSVKTNVDIIKFMITSDPGNTGDIYFDDLYFNELK